MNKKTSAVISAGIGLLCMALLITIVSFSTMRRESEVLSEELNSVKAELSSAKEELTITRENLSITTTQASQLRAELDATKQELDEAMAKIESLGQIGRTYNGWPMYWRTVPLSQEEIDFFAKLLYCEAGGMGYDGQFWVASAILNLSEISNMSIWDMGHKVNMFEVAPYVDKATPTQEQYDIINEVLNNGWIADVAYFRTDYAHDFGKFMTRVENVYFNSP